MTHGTTGHTKELVRVYPLGAGANLFHKHENKWQPGTRILDNTQLYHVMMEAAGVPQASPLNIKNNRVEPFS